MDENPMLAWPQTLDGRQIKCNFAKYQAHRAPFNYRGGYGGRGGFRGDFRGGFRGGRCVNPRERSL
jgi:hypothetical protein